MTEPRRAWLLAAEAEPDPRAPLAVRFPAEPGWRVVWTLLRDVPAGVRALRREVAINVEPVTGWGLEAPALPPAPSAPLVPLLGPDQIRLHPKAVLFALISPGDPRASAQLQDECRDFIERADRL